MHRLNLTFAVIALALVSGCKNNDSSMNNPFFENWSDNHGAIPFDKIKTEHYKPAVLKGIELEDQEIAAIVNNPEKPTFQNTIEALEYTGDLLGKVLGVAYNIVECNGTDDMLALAEEMQPILSEHSLNISLNEKLFQRVKSVWDEYNAKNFEGLTTEQQRLLKRRYDGYLKAGATLQGKARERWRKIQSEMDSLTLAYGQNVQKATGEWSYQLDPEKDLEGLPDFFRETLKGNGYKLTLLAPSYRPFMQYSARRDLREMLYKAYNSRCTSGQYDNTDVLRRIALLRQEKADLLGFESFADLQLTNKMAKTPAAVNNLLGQLLEAYRPTAEKDVKEVADLAKKDGVNDLKPWDYSYYCEKLKTAKYNFNDEQIKPYFALENVKKGVFGLATRLYGVTFNKIDVPVYDKDVECFEVWNHTEGDSTFIGLLYTDFFPRATKRPGAWMTEFRDQKIDQNGEDIRPIVQIVMSFSKPIGNPGDKDYTPSLLTYDEAETFLHEFGHSLHGLLTRCHYPSQSGTSVARDFVELPSQFNENFLGKKEFLDTFAKNWQSGEAMPQELIDRLHAAETFQAGYACLRQLSFGMLDMKFHTLGANSNKKFDLSVVENPAERFPQLANIEKFEKEATAPTTLLSPVEGTMVCTSFTHIFSGGYAAGYYGYKWAEVLDADAFAVFEKEGLDNPETAKRFRHLLESGDTVDPAELYRQFKGADPSIDALMRRDGIIK